jgi:hypothetical protein
MEALPYEAQTALVSFLSALLIGGSVSLFGASTVAGVVRTAFQFAMRRKIVTSLGVSSAAALGTMIASRLGFGIDAESAGMVIGMLG